MQLPRTFGCFCGIQHFKTLTGMTADNIMLMLSNSKAKQHQDTSWTARALTFIGINTTSEVFVLITFYT